MRRFVRALSPLAVVVTVAGFGGETHAARQEPSAAEPDAKTRPGCPKDMARVGDTCVDRYEAPNHKGSKPLVMETAMEAEDWCALRHKRLCQEDEWISACEGAQRRTYPYGNEHEDGRCNDDKEWRTVNEATLAIVWLGPLRPSTYFIGSILFLFTVGASYAGFTSVVLEFLGKSGKSGSARYSIINALGNIPVASMVLIDGLGYAHWGIRGMPGIDVVVGSAASLSLLAYFLTHPRKPTPVPRADDIPVAA